MDDTRFLAATNKCLAQSNKPGTGAKRPKSANTDLIMAADAEKS
jgi:hypothetical protein